MFLPGGVFENFIKNMAFEPHLKDGEPIILKFFVYIEDHRRYLRSESVIYPEFPPFC